MKNELEKQVAKAICEAWSENKKNAVLAALKIGETPRTIEKVIIEMMMKKYPELPAFKINQIAAETYLAAKYAKQYVLPKKNNNGPSFSLN